MIKKLKYIGLSIAIICLFASCSDWLSVTANTKIRANQQFNDVEGFKDALIGDYLNMASPTLYGKDMTWNFVDILSHQYHSLSSFSTYFLAQNYRYQRQRVMKKINAMWTSMYKTIANINLELENIKENPNVLGPINHDIIKGELLGLRAFLHFDLMRLFGYGNLANRDVSSKPAIPYMTKYTKVPTARHTYKKTLNMLLSDIQKSLQLLKMDPVYKNPDRPDNFYDRVKDRTGFYEKRRYRMNYYAVKALQARVLMWIGGKENYQKALDAALEVIKDSPEHLIDASSYNVAGDPVLYPEMLFGLKIHDFKDIINHLLVKLVQTSSSQDPNDLYYPDQTIHTIFETDIASVGLSDIRYTKLMQKQPRGFISIELQQHSASLIDHPNTMPLITLPEMYYIVAEAYAKTNRVGKAIDYLNTMRKHRGITKLILSSADKQKVLKEIGKAYQKEFLMEGQLFFYYKRTGKKHIPGVSNHVVGDAIYKLPYPDSQVIVF